MILDAHSDLLYDVTRRRLLGEKRVLERCHLARLRRGGVEGMVLALWTDRGHGETFWERVPGAESAAGRTEIMCKATRAEFAESPWLAVVRTAGEAEAARAAGKLYAFLAVEGMDAIGTDLEGIDRYADFGVRLGMLTWNGENALAAGAGCDPDRGLTDLGRRVVRRMRERGMILDVSHLNRRGFWDALEVSEGAVLASHSNCAALCDVPRNLTDEQLRAIRDCGGVVGVNSFHGFVHREARQQTVETLALHAAHMAEVMGPEHVICGFDFCHFMEPGNESAAGIEDAGQAGVFLRCLEKLGMSEAEREGIARDNFLRFMGAQTPTKLSDRKIV